MMIILWEETLVLVGYIGLLKYKQRRNKSPGQGKSASDHHGLQDAMITKAPSLKTLVPPAQTRRRSCYGVATLRYSIL